MSLSKYELIEKLKTISDLWTNVKLINQKKEDFLPDDNYERKIVVPEFPGEYQSEEERYTLINKCDHSSNHAVEQMRFAHNSMYMPTKPKKPLIEEFKEPKPTKAEIDKITKFSILGVVGAIIAVFFALGFLAILPDQEYASTLPIIAGVAGVGVVLLVIAMFNFARIMTSLKRRTNESLALYNRKKDETLANYSKEMKTFEKAKESYEATLKTFLEEYVVWRKIYLEHLEEEAQISERLEQDRLAGVEKIDEEEFTPALIEFAEANDIISADYISAIDIIIELLESGRADDLKEAINLYEDIVYRERQLELQREQEEQRQREEALRRQDEERRHREEMRFREDQERQRQREEAQRQQDAERRHREEMNQREQQERNRQYEEQRQRAAEQRKADKAELARRQEEDRAMRRQCNTCALNINCSMAFRRPNCASYRPR